MSDAYPQPRRRRSRWWIPAIAVVVVIAVAAAMVWLSSRGHKDGEASSPQAGHQTSTPASQPGMDSSSGDGPGGELISGAKLDSHQRTWPDTFIDDSAHATPGQVSVDLLSRPVFTPVNHDGDLPSISRDSLDRAAWPDRCRDVETGLAGVTRQQYVNARYLVVNDQAGPSTMNRDVPAGYAPTPAGAVVAALNLVGYGVYAVGDEVGEEIDRQLWTTSKEAQEERQWQKLDEHGPSDHSRSQMFGAMSGYRVRQCSPDVVVVDVVAPVMEGNPEPSPVARVSMYWRDGDWRPDFTGAAGDQFSNQPSVRSLDGFTEVVYQ